MRALDAGIMPYASAPICMAIMSARRAGDDGARAENPFFGVAPFNLTIAMSELLHLGVPLDQVVAMVTSHPAKLLRMENQIGSITPGFDADISVLSMETGRFKLSDNSGVNVTAETLLRPVFCLRGGIRFDADSVFIPDAIAA